MATAPKSTCLIKSKSYSEETGSWTLDVDVNTPTGTRTGLHASSLPADATDAQLQKDILSQYGA